MPLKTYTDEAELKADADRALDQLLKLVRGKSFINTVDKLSTVMASSKVWQDSGAAIFTAALHRLQKLE